MKLGTFLDCGCFIGPEGRRTLCPSCASFTPIVPVGYVTERECRERERRAYRLGRRDEVDAIARLQRTSLYGEICAAADRVYPDQLDAALDAARRAKT